MKSWTADDDPFEDPGVGRQAIAACALAALRHLSEAGLTGDLSFRSELVEAEGRQLIPQVRPTCFFFLIVASSFYFADQTLHGPLASYNSFRTTKPALRAHGSLFVRRRCLAT